MAGTVIGDIPHWHFIPNARGWLAQYVVEGRVAAKGYGPTKEAAEERARQNHAKKQQRRQDP